MRLRSGRISPNCTEMSPNQRFPFKQSVHMFPYWQPDYHLVHTSILNILQSEQSRSFPLQSVLFLASFAVKVSNSNNMLLSANKTIPDPLSTRNHFKAGYAVHSFCIPQNRFNPFSWSCHIKKTGFLHKQGSPR